jgi:hypothetical protein
VLTADGIRIAVFCTKVYNRLFAPLTAANQPQAPPTSVLRWRPSPVTYASRARLAGSTGVRKKLGEPFRWFHESERLAGAVVEAGCDAGQVGGGVH